MIHRFVDLVRVGIPIPYVATNGSNHHVEIVSSDPGQDPTALSTPTASNVLSPITSPNGLFVAWEEGSRLKIVGTDGTGEADLQTGRVINGLDWAKDSSVILFNDQTSGVEDELRTIEPDGSNLATLYTDPSNRALGLPSYNHDGTLIAFLVDLGATVGLWTANANGSGAAQVASFTMAAPTADVQVYAWGNMSDVLVYKTGTTLHVVNSDGTGDTLIVTDADLGNPLRGCWLPDDSAVYYWADIFNGILRQAQADGSGTSLVFDESATSSYGEMIFVAANSRIYVSGVAPPGPDDQVASYALDGSDRRIEADTAGDYSMF